MRGVRRDDLQRKDDASVAGHSTPHIETIHPGNQKMPRSLVCTLSLTALSFIGLIMPVPAAAGDTTAAQPKSDWEAMIGAGLAVGPKYEGGRKLQLSPFPFVSVTWRQRVFLEGLRAGVYAINTDSFKLAASVGYGGGREEKDGPRLKGMGKIRPSFQPQISAAYTLGPVTLSSAVQRNIGGNKGLTANFGASVEAPVTERLSLNAGVSATWADSNFMKSNFGVTEAQSKSSGNRVFNASSGFKSVDVTAGAQLQVTEHWVGIASVGLETLVGDARKSPVTERDHAFVSVIGAAYKF